jgi:hypothetical protein
MNCKPDQLCRVTRGLNKEALVRTIHRCGCLEDFATAAAGEGGMWRTEALQHVTDEKDGERCPPGTHMCFADSHLKPLGGEGPEDKTISEDLKKFVDSETRKIIPLVWNPEEEKV